MRKIIEKCTRSIEKKPQRSRTITGVVLTGLIACAALLGPTWFFTARSSSLGAANPVVNLASMPVQDSQYLYYVLKKPEGFVLARARKGTSNQPVEMPQEIASFNDNFGMSTADNVVTLQLSPDGHYLAIDGTRSDCELVWIFDTRRLTLTSEPANVSGSFLHWIPGSSETFLYRPMFPRGQNAPMDNGNWNPGLWKVNAVTGALVNIDIHMPSAFLVDAVASPDGTRIVYSTSKGLGTGSTIWRMGSNGQDQVQMLQMPGNAQSIAGFFTWSPNGQEITYERLADSPTPFLPAGLWIMNNQGTAQRYLAQADGGHGYAPSWSPDGRKIAFVVRTNAGSSLADQQVQALDSGIDVVDVGSGQTRMVAGPAQTGVQINAIPVWSADSSHLTFAAFNPLNPVVGGKPRYWSVPINATAARPYVMPLSSPIENVIAFG
jgi:dipeptidyl aminopeptidase/acylaminoacyl peptidase